jgi:hypothetical protein
MTSGARSSRLRVVKGRDPVPPKSRLATRATPAAAISIPVPSERIRWTRVMTAQARLAVGYYDRPDVLERLADAVLHELEQH